MTPEQERREEVGRQFNTAWRLYEMGYAKASTQFPSADINKTIALAFFEVGFEAGTHNYPLGIRSVTACLPK